MYGALWLLWNVGTKFRSSGLCTSTLIMASNAIKTELLTAHRKPYPALSTSYMLYHFQFPSDSVNNMPLHLIVHFMDVKLL